ARRPREPLARRGCRAGDAAARRARRPRLQRAGRAGRRAVRRERRRRRRRGGPAVVARRRPARRRQMQRPPSTSIATPVIIDASSLHKKHAALPRSSGVEKRPSGIVARNLARISGVSSPRKVLSSGVSPATGFSALTRMPKGASSTAIARVAVITQPLLALYQANRGRGLTPAVLAMFRITPRFCALKRGTASLAAR